jgi:putative hydrolase of the HAD superfamily
MSSAGAITFDAGGTLLHTDPSPGEIYARVAARYGLVVSGEAMSKAFRETWEEIHGEDRFHAAGAEQGREYWREIVYRTLSKVGDMPDPEPCFLELYELFADPRVWKLDPAARVVLERAGDLGLGVGLVSNWDSRLRGLLDKLDLLSFFDAVAISCEVGIEKPHPGIFRNALAGLGASHESVIHIGDTYRDDVIGADRAGIRAVLIHRNGGPPPRPCATAPSLLEAFEHAVRMLG